MEKELMYADSRRQNCWKFGYIPAMMEPMHIMKMLETDMAMKTGIIRLLNSAGKILLDV